VIPFVDVVGNGGTVPPAHIVKVEPKLNVGAVFVDTVTVSVTVVDNTHCPGLVVNV
jgi:hypothetical protein